MKKLLIILLFLIVLPLILLGGLFIYDQIKIVEVRQYDLTEIYENYNFDNVTTILPNIEITYLEQKGLTIGREEREGGQVLMILSHPYSKEFENIVYYTNISCTDGSSLKRDYLRLIGMPVFSFYINEQVFIPRNPNENMEINNDTYMLFFQQMFSKNLLSMNCSTNGERSNASIFIEIIDTDIFAELYGIPVEDIWIMIRGMNKVDWEK